MNNVKSHKKGQERKTNEAGKVKKSTATRAAKVETEKAKESLPERDEGNIQAVLQDLDVSCEKVYNMHGIRGVQAYLSDEKVRKVCTKLGGGPRFFLKYVKECGHFRPWGFGNLMDFGVDLYEIKQEKKRQDKELQMILDKNGPKGVESFLWKRKGKYYDEPDVFLVIFPRNSFIYMPRSPRLTEVRDTINVSTSKEKKERLKGVIERLNMAESTKKGDNMSDFMMEAAWGTAILMEAFGVTMGEVFVAACLYLDNKEEMDSSQGKR